MAILADRNVTQKEAENKPKYEILCIEIQRMWNMKCMIILVIIFLEPSGHLGPVMGLISITGAIGIATKV